MANGAALAKRLPAVGAALVKNNQDATKRAAMAYKAAALKQGSKDSGGDLRLSRWGKRGVKLGVGFDVEGSGGTAKAVVAPRPMGPWKVLEYGAAPHLIVPGLTRRQTKALTLFSVMAGQGGSLDGYDISGLAASARGTRNNRGGARRRKRRPPLKIGGNVRAWARHPGTTGKKTWSKGIAKGSDDAIAGYRKAQGDAIAKVFR
jgi:hypothetical protein